MADTLRQSPSGPELGLTSDDIENESTVAGATVSDALDTLGGVFGTLQPGQSIGRQIDAAPGPPVALTGLEQGENLRIGTRQFFSTSGTTTLALNADTNRIDKSAGSSVTLNGMTGGASGRLVILQHSSPGGTTTTIPNDAAGTSGFLTPNAVNFVYDAGDGLAGLAFYDSITSRWRVMPRGFSRAEPIVWTGNHTFNGALFTVSASGNIELFSLTDIDIQAAGLLTLLSNGGNVVVQSNTGSVDLTATGDINVTSSAGVFVDANGSFTVSTSSTERLEITPTGAWQVNGDSGLNGQTFVSRGASNSPVWTNGILLTLGATASISADAATTNLSAGSITIPANSTAAGHTYRAVMALNYNHTAALTPTLTMEWVYGGAVIETRTITPAATAGSFSMLLDATLRFHTIGAAGSAISRIGCVNDFGNTIIDQQGTRIVNIAGPLNTTISRTLEFRIRMTTAVASNILTLFEATLERLITP